MDFQSDFLKSEVEHLRFEVSELRNALDDMDRWKRDDFKPKNPFDNWVPGGGGGGVKGFTIYTRKHAMFHVTYQQAIENYDPEVHLNWSLEFAVNETDFQLDNFEGSGDPVSISNPIGTQDVNIVSNIEYLHDADASTDPATRQTYYRIPMLRDEKWVSKGGVYRENLVCAGEKGISIELLRIG